jgi:hypothetical protein
MTFLSRVYEMELHHVLKPIANHIKLWYYSEYNWLGNSLA